MSDQDQGDNSVGNPKLSWPVRLINKIHKVLDEPRSKKRAETSEQKHARRLTNATIVIAFFSFATIVISVLTFFILKWQLDEMEREQRPIIWITNNLQLPALGPLPVDNNYHVIWSFEYTNYGKSFAKDVKVDFFIKLGDNPFKRSFGALRAGLGGDLPPGGVKTNYGSIVSEAVDQAEFSRLLQTNFGIVALIEFEYWDIIGNRYISEVCFGRIATGAVANIEARQCIEQRRREGAEAR